MNVDTFLACFVEHICFILFVQPWRSWDKTKSSSGQGREERAGQLRNHWFRRVLLLFTWVLIYFLHVWFYIFNSWDSEIRVAAVSCAINGSDEGRLGFPCTSATASLPDPVKTQMEKGMNLKIFTRISNTKYSFANAHFISCSFQCKLTLVFFLNLMAFQWHSKKW